MRVAVKIAAGLVCLWCATAWLPGAGAWAFGLVVVLVAVPLTLLGAYSAAIRRAHLTMALSRDGWLLQALSGAVLRVGLNATAALALAFVAVARMIGLSGADWGALAVTALAVPPATVVWQRSMASQFEPTYQLAVSIRMGRITALAMGLLVYLAVSMGGDFATPARDSGLGYKSALIGEIIQISAQWQLLEAFALGELSALGQWGRAAAAMTVVVTSLALFWVVTGLSAAMMLPQAARHVALAPVASESPTREGLTWISALLTLLVLFIYVPAVAGLEASLRALPALQRPSQVFVTQVEDIGGQFFEPGTMAALTERQETELATLSVQSRARLETAVQSGFDAMEANVDPFLDWYYSIPAEYGRIGHLLLGDVEDFLSQRLQAELSQGAPFTTLQQTIAEVDLAHESLAADLVGQLTDQSQARRVILSESQPVQVTRSAPSLEAVLTQVPDPFAQVQAQLERRLLQTGGSAGVAGLLTASVMVKLGSKGVVKTAAKAVAKVAASKAAGGTAGAGTGALAGGLVGSVFPGVGTALGAAIGGALGGVAVGVGVDALLLELEETLQREDLRRDILSALQEARAETLAFIGDSLEEN